MAGELLYHRHSNNVRFRFDEAYIGRLPSLNLAAVRVQLQNNLEVENWLQFVTAWSPSNNAVRTALCDYDMAGFYFLSLYTSNYKVLKQQNPAPFYQWLNQILHRAYSRDATNAELEQFDSIKPVVGYILKALGSGRLPRVPSDQSRTPDQAIFRSISKALWPAHLVEGQAFWISQFWSCSSDLAVMPQFMNLDENSLLIRICSYSGVDIGAISHFNEREVLLPPGTCFLVRSRGSKVHDTNNGRKTMEFVDLQEVRCPDANCQIVPPRTFPTGSLLSFYVNDEKQFVTAVNLCSSSLETTSCAIS